LKFEKGTLILNPSSGKFYNFFYLKRIIEYFKDLKTEISIKKTDNVYDLRKKTEEAIKEGSDFIGALGGDGTIREVGSVLVDTSIPMLIVPFGTSNVLAYSLNIPLHPLKAIKLLEDGEIKKIDGGIANGDYFFYAISTGIDAKIMESQNIHFKKIFGRFSFYPAVLKNLLSYDFPEIFVESKDFSINGFYIAISNVPYFAGKYKLFEGASPFDGFLDMLILKEKGVKNYVKYFLELKNKKYDKNLFELKKIKEIDIKSKSIVPYQIDGDIKGNLPLKIKIKEKSLPLFLPSSV
jgi:YegS/Rv2252/BmrU family lipid kinase